MWKCKILGHKWKEFDRKELNKTGAYTAKQRCLRCGKVENLGLCLEAKGAIEFRIPIRIETPFIIENSQTGNAPPQQEEKSE